MGRGETATGGTGVAAYSSEGESEVSPGQASGRSDPRDFSEGSAMEFDALWAAVSLIGLAVTVTAIAVVISRRNARSGPPFPPM